MARYLPVKLKELTVEAYWYTAITAVPGLAHARAEKIIEQNPYHPENRNRWIDFLLVLRQSRHTRVQILRGRDVDDTDDILEELFPGCIVRPEPADESDLSDNSDSEDLENFVEVNEPNGSERSSDSDESSS